MAAISALSAELTSRWRARSVLDANWGDTIIALKAWPQPPVRVGRKAVSKQNRLVGLHS
jgi:hypothetical protein